MEDILKLPLLQEIANQIGLDLENDTETLLGIFKSIREQGMASCCIDGFVYYEDTSSFYDKYKDEINSYLVEYAKSRGLTFNGLVLESNDDDSLLDLLENDGAIIKNNLVWLFIELIACKCEDGF